MSTDPTAGTAPGAATLPGDLVDDIASLLAACGEYRIVLEPGPPQRVVDLRWAALGAGQRIGRKVHVAVTRAGIDAATATTTVRMTCTPPRGTAIPHQRGPQA